MISNDILRSLRYTLKTNNNDLVRIFALADAPVSAEQLVPWLKKEDEEGLCAARTSCCRVSSTA
jgi:uncharacterized protein YehS (DUF1456 family)